MKAEQNTFEDMTVGRTASFSRTVSAQAMDAFAAISGDENPLHTNETYAKAQGQPGRVVYGMLTASLYSTLCGMFLPGERSLLQSVEAKFHKPVFIGDTLTVSGEVVERHETLGVIRLRAVIRNQHGKRVSSASLQVGVRSLTPEQN